MFALIVMFSALTQTQPNPINTLKASYPWGEPRCLEVTPDRTRTFVALGEVISVLDTSTLPYSQPNPAFDYIQVPGAAPTSLLYYKHPSGSPQWLFIAGGSMGLWSVQLCPGLFNTPPTPCSSYSPYQVDIIDSGPSGTIPYQRKRCIKVAVVPNNITGSPLLFALFSASSSSSISPNGPSELRAYTLSASGSGQPQWYATFPLTITGGPGDPIATGMAADPNDGNSLYVAMGTAWLYKVNIGVYPFTMAQVLPAPSCSLSHCPSGEKMTDIALVSTASGSFIYATLEYGRLAEYGLGSGSFTATSVPSAFAARIAATSSGGSRVMIAVESRFLPDISANTAAPYCPTGLWYTNCLTAQGFLDPNPSGLTGQNQMSFFLRIVTPGATQWCPLTPSGIPCGRDYAGSLAMRTENVNSYLSFECRNLGEGTVIRRIILNGIGLPCPPTTINTLNTYVDRGFPCFGTVVSQSNPGLVRCGFDGGSTGEFVLEDNLFITKRSPIPPYKVDIVRVDQTTGSCPGQRPIPPVSSCNSVDPRNSFDPNPFGSGLFNEAHWSDPYDTTREWFLRGGFTQGKVQISDCTLLGCQCGDPCYLPNQLLFGFCNAVLPGEPFAVGWKWISIVPGTYGTTVPTGSSMSMNWWQIGAPSNSNETSPSEIYFHSAPDPRTVAVNGHPIPQFIHCVRNGSDYGYEVFDTSLMITASRQQCGQVISSCSGIVTTSGAGEDLLQALLPNQYAVEARSHVEFEDPGSGEPCKVVTICQPEPPDLEFLNPHQLYNGGIDFYQTTDDLGRIRQMAVMAAGHVGTDASPIYNHQSTSCQWTNEGGRPMISVFDIEQLSVSGNSPPQLVRVGIGFDSGYAWTVRVKTYPTDPPRTFAFVGDATGPDGPHYNDAAGRILVFEVTGSAIYPAATSPYRPVTGNWNAVLRPLKTLVFPRDPVDGYGSSVTDVQLDPDGDIAYVALGRGGVAVVDLAWDPIAQLPKLGLLDIIDTPGVATGLTIRQNEVGLKQLVVSDTRGGLRLFSRPGE